MIEEKKTTQGDIQTEAYNRWFDNLVDELRVDQLMIKADVLESHEKSMYDAMISDNQEYIHDYARKASSMFFFKSLVSSYIAELTDRKAQPIKLALDLSNSKLLVWAVINDDDETTENALILAAAKVNSDYGKYGFHISSTIVENSDNLPLPKHYRAIKTSLN